MSIKPDHLYIDYISGCPESFGPLVEALTPRMFGFFVRLGTYPHDAEDLCQEFFTALARGASTFDPSQPFMPWAYRIARNIHIKHSCRRSRVNVIPFHEWAADCARQNGQAGNAGDPVEAVEARDQIDRLLAVLTGEKREVLVLRHFQGLSFTEISQILGIPEGTAKSRVFTALADLRGAAKKENP